MKKLLVLIKKEVRELITLQMIVTMAVMIGLFVFIGNVVGEETKKSNTSRDIAVLDLDRTESSRAAIGFLKESGFNATELSEQDKEQALRLARERNIAAVLIIPEGFDRGISARKPQTLETYTAINNFTVAGIQKNAALDSAVSGLNAFFSDQIIEKNISGGNPETVKNPIGRNDWVITSAGKANVNPNLLIAFIQSQTMIIPIALFFVIIFAASMLATAVATEKENKTLETLLTMPVDRRLIVLAKMIGAGVVALLSAAVYLFGIRYYINGISGNALNGMANLGSVMEQLGLTFTPPDYLLLGATMFLGIMCGLAIAMVIGSFSQSAKNAQGMITPLILLVMIPYFLTMFIDISAASLLMKSIIYAIPFSYSFLAVQNIFLHNYALIVAGIVYQTVFFAVFVFLAAKIFSTDKIITMRLNLKGKAKNNSSK
ncbi:MAG: ABC transporter permease [Endomicrobiaceae bacterium]|nr:ABC transporter permease [Endomicrobiaceae bacterium]